MKATCRVTLAAFASLVLVAVGGGAAVAQEKASMLKQHLVSAWTLVDVYFEWQGVRRTQPYGPDVKGRLVLDQNGLFSFQVIGANRPKFASSNRREGTPEENATVVRMTESFFGTYSVDEADQTITLRLEHAMFPNWDGSDRKHKVVFKGAEMLTTGPLTPSTTGFYIPNQLWKRTN